MGKDPPHEGGHIKNTVQQHQRRIELMTRTIAVIITGVRMYEQQDQGLPHYLPSAVLSWGLGGGYLSLDVTIMTMEIAIMIDTETNTAPHRTHFGKKSEKQKLTKGCDIQLWIRNMRKTKHYFIKIT